jgi:glutamate synthase (NADPH/NADH) small chain
VLDIDDDPVMIKQIEYWTINNAFENGWVTANPPAVRTGKTVAVVGSGPAGMAAADELNKIGHTVTVYERDEAPGGLLRFGVPDAKLEKWMIDRRIDLLEAEGVEFVCDVEAGVDITADELRDKHDAVVLAMGSRVERDLELPGRELDGVHFAMEYLYQRNRWVAKSQGRPSREPERQITAAGKRVVVIGGGDTGMDCVSNALREGAEDVILLDVYPEVPQDGRYPNTPWPIQPRRLITTYALEEGGERRFGREVLGLEGSGGAVERVLAREVTGDSSRTLVGVEGSEFAIDAELVLIAVGFTHPEREGLIDGLGVDLDKRGNVKAGAFSTSLARVYAAGDVRVGASLVVTAIAEGRRCARVVERYLAADRSAAPA